MILQLAAESFPLVASEVAGVAALGGGLALVAAIVHRWYAGERIQDGLAVLVGLAAVAVYLNTTTAIGQVIGGRNGLFVPEVALVNVGTFVLGGGASLVGRRLGDRLAVEALVVTGSRELKADVGRFVPAVGRVLSVTVPDAIDDMPGYDPVPDETKAALAGTSFLFPRRLTLSDLRDRLRTRLADDYGIGHVDVELADDGRIEYLAVGSRAAGLGPTLAPGTAAVAIRADPAFAASSGDVVEVWRRTTPPQRVAIAEIRGRAGDLVTIALDEPDALTLDPDERYRLVSRPATPRADREFAGVLRAADERLAAVTVEADSDLDGTPLELADAVVVAFQPSDGQLIAVPPRDRVVSGGDVLYALGRPEAIRRLEAAATGSEPEPSS